MTADSNTGRIHRDADRLLLRVVSRGGWWLALLGCTSLASVTAQLLLPAAVGHTMDAAIGGSGTGEAIGSWLTACAALVAVIVAARAVVTLATGMATATATAWLRRALADHVVGCGPGLLQRLSTGDTVSRIVGGTADAGAAPASAVMAITAVIPPVGSVIALGLIDPWLMVAFAAGFPALAVVLRAFLRDTSDVTADYQQAQGAIAGRLLDALAGARTVAAAGTYGEEVRRILAPLASLRDRGHAAWRVQARAVARSQVIAPLLQVIVLAVAGVQLARHRITPGELLAASQYAVLAVGIGASFGQLNRLGRARGGGRRAAGLMVQPRPAFGAESLAPGPGQLQFRNVTVRLNGEATLSGLDLIVPGGTAVAVVGRSGAGKSLLAGLAGRLLDPDAGEVMLDGLALPRLARSELRRAIVYAFERPALFGATPFEAITFGAWQPPRAQILTAMSESRADTFLARLPDGIETPLDDMPMSGGEVQRLGLARAFAHARDARLLILDDATSSLDTATEMQVSGVLTGRLSDRTRLIVAHRATTAARADLVAWLDGGRLRALGPHSELWGDAGYRAAFGAGPQ